MSVINTAWRSGINLNWVFMHISSHISYFKFFCIKIYFLPYHHWIKCFFKYPSCINSPLLKFVLLSNLFVCSGLPIESIVVISILEKWSFSSISNFVIDKMICVVKGHFDGDFQKKKISRKNKLYLRFKAHLFKVTDAYKRCQFLTKQFYCCKFGLWNQLMTFCFESFYA